MNMLQDFFLNYYLLTFVAAWVSSTLLKAALHSWKHKTKFHMKDGFQNGGMPSTHTTIVAALTCSIFFRTGFSDLFFISAIFSSIVIADAIRIRKNVGLQGEKINELLKKFDEKTIHVVYGHSSAQVFAGLLLGLACALTFRMILF